MRGCDKLLEKVDGTPLLARAVAAARAAAREVIVVLPEGDIARASVAGHARIIRVTERAMSASIRAGVAACTAGAALLHLADMPEIGSPELRVVIQAWRRGTAPILRATAADGTPGQPVVFARALFPELDALRGDQGARRVLRRHPVDTVALPGRAALTDLDTPEDWARWRDGQVP